MLKKGDKVNRKKGYYIGTILNRVKGDLYLVDFRDYVAIVPRKNLKPLNSNSEK